MYAALRYPADVAGVVLSNTWGRTDAFLRVLFEHWISLAGKGRATPNCRCSRPVT
jgi:pimeloyl-ACP methyl ester carboxylesterase